MKKFYLDSAEEKEDTVVCCDLSLGRDKSVEITAHREDGKLVIDSMKAMREDTQERMELLLGKPVHIGQRILIVAPVVPLKREPGAYHAPTMEFVVNDQMQWERV